MFKHINELITDLHAMIIVLFSNKCLFVRMEMYTTSNSKIKSAEFLTESSKSISYKYIRKAFLVVLPDFLKHEQCSLEIHR